MGKSRLAVEVHEQVMADDPLWLESSCSSYTRMSVLRPVIDLVEEVLDFGTDHDPVHRLERIRSELAQAGVDVVGADELIATLLGIPSWSTRTISSELRLDRTIEALVTWVVALSRERPLVLLVEDLHWCDPTTLDAIDRLLGAVTDVPVLVLLTARPEFVPAWDNAGMVTTVTLEPLGEKEVRELVSTLGDGRSLPEQVVERIVASAAGIPLYVEEVGRTVLDSGLLVGGIDTWDLASPLVDLEIPGTLQGSLLARLDSLGPAKAVAQLAAVSGGPSPSTSW